MEAWIKGSDGVTYTRGGLAWGSEWGSLRFVGNAAMVASVYAKNIAGATNVTAFSFQEYALAGVQHAAFAVSNTDPCRGP